MNSKQFLSNIHETFIQCEKLVIVKNADYADSDDPFKNFNNSLLVGVDPARAILVRITDKISRIGNLLDKPGEVSDEKVEDSIRDAINYLAILKVLHEYKKPLGNIGLGQIAYLKSFPKEPYAPHNPTN